MKHLFIIALILALTLTGKAQAGVVPFEHTAQTVRVGATPHRAGNYRFLPALGESVKHLGKGIGSLLFSNVQDFKIINFSIVTPIPGVAISACVLEIDNRPLPKK